MVILGGLEVLAAGYLYHKHEQNKKERLRLAEEDAAIEQEIRKLEDKRRQRKSAAPSSPHYLAVPGASASGRPEKGRRHRRDHSAPPAPPLRPGAGVSGDGRPSASATGYMPVLPARPASQTIYGTSAPTATQTMPMSPPPSAGLGAPLMSPPPPYPTVVTGWPAHWGASPEQSRTPGPPPPSGPFSMPVPMMSPAGGSMPPTPPIEYGWKPGASYTDAPTETAQDREVRRARRKERKAEQARHEAESSRNVTASPSTAKPFQRVRFTGLAEGMEVKPSRYETVQPGVRGRRWESGGGGMDCGGGGGGGC